jgi:hypothetical protein
MAGETNNLTAFDGEYFGDINDDRLDKDSLPLCLHCLRPCEPHQYYCPNCLSNDTINPLTPYLPFVNLRFNYGFFGSMWRTIWYRPDASIFIKISCLFMTILFAPILLLVGLPLFLVNKVKHKTLRNLLTFGIIVFAFFLLYFLRDLFASLLV